MEEWVKINDNVWQKQTEIDWEQRRYEIAKEVLPLIIGDTVIDYLDVVEVAKGAVRLSDALIEELKKK